MLHAPDVPALIALMQSRDFGFWAAVVALIWVVFLGVWVYAFAGVILADRANATRIVRGLPMDTPRLSPTAYYRMVESAYIVWGSPSAVMGNGRKAGLLGRDNNGRTWHVFYSHHSGSWEYVIATAVGSLYPNRWVAQATRRKAQDAVVALLMQE